MEEIIKPEAGMEIRIEILGGNNGPKE